MPLRYRVENVAYHELDAGRAYAAGYAPGRHTDFDSEMSNWRLAERGINYAKKAVEDIDKATREKRKGFLQKLVESAAKTREEAKKKEEKKK